MTACTMCMDGVYYAPGLHAYGQNPAMHDFLAGHALTMRLVKPIPPWNRALRDSDHVHDSNHVCGLQVPHDTRRHGRVHSQINMCDKRLWSRPCNG